MTEQKKILESHKDVLSFADQTDYPVYIAPQNDQNSKQKCADAIDLITQADLFFDDDAAIRLEVWNAR